MASKEREALLPASGREEPRSLMASPSDMRKGLASENDGRTVQEGTFPEKSQFYAAGRCKDQKTGPNTPVPLLRSRIPYCITVQESGPSRD